LQGSAQQPGVSAQELRAGPQPQPIQRRTRAAARHETAPHVGVVQPAQDGRLTQQRRRAAAACRRHRNLPSSPLLQGFLQQAEVSHPQAGRAAQLGGAQAGAAQDGA
jgi:hypothetical protein